MAEGIGDMDLDNNMPLVPDEDLGEDQKLIKPGRGKKVGKHKRKSKYAVAGAILLCLPWSASLL